jgi:hypothetical protein
MARIDNFRTEGQPTLTPGKYRTRPNSLIQKDERKLGKRRRPSTFQRGRKF